MSLIDTSLSPDSKSKDIKKFYHDLLDKFSLTDNMQIGIFMDSDEGEPVVKVHLTELLDYVEEFSELVDCYSDIRSSSHEQEKKNLLKTLIEYSRNYENIYLEPSEKFDNQGYKIFTVKY